MTFAVAVVITPLVLLGFGTFVLDAYSMIIPQTFWDVILPEHGEMSATDRWISANIWIAPYIEYVVSRTHGTK